MSALDELKSRIETFHQLFGEVEDDYEDFDEEICRIPNMEPSEFFAFVEKRAGTPFGRLFFTDFHDFMVAEVLAAYTRGSEEERQAILDQFRQCFRSRINAWSLMEHYRWRLQHSKKEERPAVLQRLLLFAILDEEDLDQFETGNILRGAWYEAEYEGMDPAQFFKEAARVAGKRKIVFGRSASEILEAFDPRQ